jgi:hypothetical protein
MMIKFRAEIIPGGCVMRFCKRLLVLGLFALMISLTGCCGGGETTVIEKQPVNTTPLGEELLKLKDAHDKGALTDKEYEDAKAKLLKGQ